jgi:stage V sporulation protein G
MKVTRVDIRMAARGEKVLAYASVTFDSAFIVHEIRLVKKNGKSVVAMPSRKSLVNCGCGMRIQFDSVFCPHCGVKNGNGRPTGRLYNDLAHPISAALRAEIEVAVLSAYEAVQLKKP